MQAVVIYESLTGTTARAARLIAEGLNAEGIATKAYPTDGIDYQWLADAQLVVIGSWTDGLIMIKQKPGRAWRVKGIPALRGKQAVVFATYAIDPGKVLDKMVDIAEALGAEVLGGMTIRRDRVAESADEFVGRIVATLSPA